MYIPLYTRLHERRQYSGQIFISVFSAQTHYNCQPTTIICIDAILYFDFTCRYKWSFVFHWCSASNPPWSHLFRRLKLNESFNRGCIGPFNIYVPISWRSNMQEKCNFTKVYNQFFFSAKFQYLHLCASARVNSKRIIQQAYVIEYFHFVQIESLDGSNTYANKHGLSKCVACKPYHLI